jgi:hypothetical protein
LASSPPALRAAAGAPSDEPPPERLAERVAFAARGRGFAGFTDIETTIGSSGRRLKPRQG